MLDTVRDGASLIVRLSGELDHCAVTALRAELEELLLDRGIMQLHFDFENVGFMDSSGVGFIIGRYKTMTARGGHVSAGNLHPPVDRLFRMGGLHRIVEITEGQGSI